VNLVNDQLTFLSLSHRASSPSSLLSPHHHFSISVLIRRTATISNLVRRLLGILYHHDRPITPFFFHFDNYRPIHSCAFRMSLPRLGIYNFCSLFRLSLYVVVFIKFITVCAFRIRKRAMDGMIRAIRYGKPFRMYVSSDWAWYGANLQLPERAPQPSCRFQMRS